MMYEKLTNINGVKMSLVILEVSEENLEEHRKQLPEGLDYEQVLEYLNECYIWNSWDDFTIENIKQDFKLMYQGEYDVVSVELVGVQDLIFETFKVNIEYHDEAKQIMHLLRWS
jgi:hypothetical protein